MRRTCSAVDPDLIPLPGYQLRQRKRKRVEWLFVFAVACNPARMRKLLAPCA